MSLYAENKPATTTTTTISPSSVISLSPAVLMNMNKNHHCLFPLNAHISLSSLLPIRENYFLPDFTERPKPHPKKRPPPPPPPPVENIGKPDQEEDENAGITFFHDFVAGGAAGSASVMVGHPFDTIKGKIFCE